MKKIFFIIIPLILIVILAVSTLLPQNNLQRLEADKGNLYNKSQKNISPDNPKEHLNQALNCKSCHASIYPTKNDPGLRSCPRKNMISEFPSSKTGPDVVVINEMSDNYTGVVFSHKIHSQMSEMTVGCTGCHHYNTTGPVLNCRECHESSRSREDVSVPDLKAAFHRQCMSCHKQWSHENGCNTQCHQRNSAAVKSADKQTLDAIKEKNHPKLTEPSKLVWETNYDAGKIVTFFHDEHNQLFRINCKSCHSSDNCIKCHEPKAQQDLSKPVKIKKSFEDHHKPCITCHEGNNCQKCHKEKEMTPFNHGKSSSWTLKSYHSQLTCTKCHGDRMPYKKLDKNCTSCHKNFTPGKFDHNKTGLILSENHRELECISCHSNNDFAREPGCKMCHDDKSYPAQTPGKKGKK